MTEPLFLVAILQVITASSVFFVWVVRYDNIIEEFVYYKLPTWLRDLVGILKVSFGIMLLMGIYDEKFKVIGAGGLSLLMIAALLTHVKVKNPLHKAVPAVTLLSFSIVIILSGLR